MVLVQKKERKKKGQEGRRKEIATIGEDVGKKHLELFYIASGDVKWCSHGGRQQIHSSKNTHRTTLWYNDSTLVTYSEELKSGM